MEEQVASPVVFIPPSAADHLADLYRGRSYTHYSPVPGCIKPNVFDSDAEPTKLQVGTPCVLGVDEAGRGPVIGPMVYGIFYLPSEVHQSLLADTHHFDDSKVLTPAVRANLMRKVCTSGTDLFDQCGWAVNSLSALDIGAGMLKNGGSYNLNAQAMDATIETIRGVLASGVNVTEIYVDTIGAPVVYQKKLERIFPTITIRVEKKADSLFPCVSAASVVAKVTRDVSCELLFEECVKQEGLTQDAPSWGSGYPSDARCVSWLKTSIDPVFGWGNECRFSWGTLKDLLEAKGGSAMLTDWPDDEDDDNMKMSHFFEEGSVEATKDGDNISNWYGRGVGPEVF